MWRMPKEAPEKNTKDMALWISVAFEISGETLHQLKVWQCILFIPGHYLFSHVFLNVKWGECWISEPLTIGIDYPRR